jgi:hypothetical protein
MIVGVRTMPIRLEACYAGSVARCIAKRVIRLVNPAIGETATDVIAKAIDRLERDSSGSGEGDVRRRSEAITRLLAMRGVVRRVTTSELLESVRKWRRHRYPSSSMSAR